MGERERDSLLVSIDLLVARFGKCWSWSVQAVVLAWTFRQLMFCGESSRMLATGCVTWATSDRVLVVGRSAGWAQIS